MKLGISCFKTDAVMMNTTLNMFKARVFKVTTMVVEDIKILE